MKELELRENSPVEVVSVAHSLPHPGDRYITVKEGMDAFYATEPKHRKTYQELAKGPVSPDLLPE